MNNNELMHFGILGMKWGVRRYQNEDGTLTTAGRKRYSKEYDDLLKKANDDVANNFEAETNDRMADKINSGLFDEFDKKHDPEDDDYGDKFGELADKVYAIEANKRTVEKYKQSEVYNMINEYGLLKVDGDLQKKAQSFMKNIDEIEEYNDTLIKDLEKMGYKY